MNYHFIKIICAFLIWEANNILPFIFTWTVLFCITFMCFEKHLINWHGIKCKKVLCQYEISTGFTVPHHTYVIQYTVTMHYMVKDGLKDNTE